MFLQGYKQQHNAFVQHATGQIQALEQQKQQIEQQAAAAAAVAASAAAAAAAAGQYTECFAMNLVIIYVRWYMYCNVVQ